MNSEPLFFDRGTAHLLEGSIELAQSAWRTGGSASGYILARASLLTTAIFVEACANICLDALDLPDKLAADLDKLSVLSKFDTAARLGKRGTMDRSRTECQGLGELFSVRNAYVHPKARQVAWRRTSEVIRTAESPRPGRLKLPTLVAYCGPDDAITALRCVHAFLRYYFAEVSKLSPAQVSALLFGNGRTPSSEAPPRHPLTIDAVQRWLKHHQIDVGYMQLWIMDGENDWLAKEVATGGGFES